MAFNLSLAFHGIKKNRFFAILGILTWHRDILYIGKSLYIKKWVNFNRNFWENPKALPILPQFLCNGAQDIFIWLSTKPSEQIFEFFMFQQFWAVKLATISVFSLKQTFLDFLTPKSRKIKKWKICSEGFLCFNEEKLFTNFHTNWMKIDWALAFFV